MVPVFATIMPPTISGMVFTTDPEWSPRYYPARTRGSSLHPCSESVYASSVLPHRYGPVETFPLNDCSQRMTTLTQSLSSSPGHAADGL